MPKISRQELAEACEDFSNIIGSSHETVVYKGTLKDGREIAVVSLSVSVHYWNEYVELYFHQEASAHQFHSSMELILRFFLLYNRYHSMRSNTSGDRNG